MQESKSMPCKGYEHNDVILSQSLTSILWLMASDSIHIGKCSAAITRILLAHRMGSSASKDFNPEQDIPDLTGKVIIVTGRKYAFRAHLSAIISMTLV